MFVVAGFKLDAYGAPVDRRACVDAFVCYGYYISAMSGDHAAYAGELSGFVRQVDYERIVAAAFVQPTGYHAVESRDVDVAA